MYSIGTPCKVERHLGFRAKPFAIKGLGGSGFRVWALGSRTFGSEVKWFRA